MPGLDANYYDILGIPTSATPEHVERAYRYHVGLYSDASLATYSLLEPGERQQARAQIQEAYDVLKDPLRRRAYDYSQGLRTPMTAVPDPAAPAASQESIQIGEPITGAALRRVREQRGIALEKIAEKSKIGLRYLQYIELDRYDELPARVYLRGFLLEYARALGLEPNRVADSYLAMLPKGR